MTIEFITMLLPDEIKESIILVSLYPNRNGSGRLTFYNGFELSILDDGYGKDSNLYECAVIDPNDKWDSLMIGQVDLEGIEIDQVIGWLTIQDVINLAAKVNRAKLK